MKWTEAKDAQLRRYELIGLSFAAIAKRMGITKNAALGRAYRLRRGLVNPDKPKPVKKPVTPRPYKVRSDGSKFFIAETRARTHPLIKEVVRLLNDREINYYEFCDYVGLGIDAAMALKNGRSTPQIHTLEAMFNALGLSLWYREIDHPAAARYAGKKPLTNTQY
jgi:hypothetical protein